MHRFWHFARRMGRHRRMLAGALAFALLSAGGLGAGLLGILPILQNILADRGEGRDLSDIGADLNARIGGIIPASWIDALPQGQFTAVIWVMIGLGVLTVIGATANFLHAYLSLTVVSRTVADIRRDTFRRVIHLPLKTVVSHGPSDLISRIVYDTATLASGFNALLSRAVAQVTKGLAALLVALLLDWRLALIALPVALVIATVIRKLGKRIRRASRKALQSQAGLYERAGEVLGGLRLVKVYTSERSEAARFHQVNKEVVRQELRVRTARALASPLVETLSIIVLGALSIIAAKAIIDGVLEPDRFILVMGSLAVAGASIKPLTGILNDIHQASAAAERISDILGLETEPGHGSELPALPRHASSITFEHVSFTYPDMSEPALCDVGLTIEHGQTVAFVGPNGSGKTTLLSLLPRLFDPDTPSDGGTGRVLVDGRDIRDCSVRSLREQIGVVTQEVVLFKGTIASNIAYGAEGATDAQIREAARQARAESFILDKPQGYDTPIGEDGAGLSGGQRQRVAIARALLRDPSILILDEATSMVDAESEARIAEALADFSKGRTCLIVAHRLSTVVNADRIVVMDGGRIVDQGTHAELLQRCPVYGAIANNQLLGPANAPTTGPRAVMPVAPGKGTTR